MHVQLYMYRIPFDEVSLQLAKRDTYSIHHGCHCTFLSCGAVYIGRPFICSGTYVQCKAYKAKTALEGCEW